MGENLKKYFPKKKNNVFFGKFKKGKKFQKQVTVFGGKFSNKFFQNKLKSFFGEIFKKKIWQNKIKLDENFTQSLPNRYL